MKGIRHLLLAAVLTGGMIGVAQAHVFVGVGIAPMMPIAPVVPVPVPVYAPVYAPPPPVYYAPPPPVYVAPPVVAGYYGYPYGWHRHYYAYGYWR